MLSLLMKLGQEAANMSGSSKDWVKDYDNRRILCLITYLLTYLFIYLITCNLVTCRSWSCSSEISPANS